MSEKPRMPLGLIIHILFFKQCIQQLITVHTTLSEQCTQQPCTHTNSGYTYRPL